MKIDANWWVWWKLIDTMKSHDCDDNSHWDDNSSLWWKVFKGIKTDHSIRQERFDVMKLHKCDENWSNTIKIHQNNVNSMINVSIRWGFIIVIESLQI